MLYPNKDSHTLGSILLTHTQNREEWALYWYLRQGGKNIFLPIFLSEVNGQHPSLPRSLPPTFSLSRLPRLNFSLLPRPPRSPPSLALSVCLQHTFISLWGGALLRAQAHRDPLTLPMCTVAADCNLMCPCEWVMRGKEGVCVGERQLGAAIKATARLLLSVPFMMW